MTWENFKYQTFRAISIIGHPLLLGTGAVWYINSIYLDKTTANKLGLQLLLSFLLPLVLFISWKIYTGYFKDFDVSNQERRKLLYKVVVGLLLFQIGLLLYQQFNKVIISGAFALLFVISACSLINNWIKISLHSSFAFLVSTMSYSISEKFAFILFMSAIFIAYSRVFLGRHASRDVFAGFLLGISTGYAFNIYITS